MAETYRKAKIVNYLNLLAVRKKSLANQISQKAFEDNVEFLKGQLSAIELIFEELTDEFELEACQETEESL